MKLKTLAVLAAAVVAVAAHGAAASPAQAAMNDPACTPSAAHPEPVVYVPGLGVDPALEYALIDPVLTAKGFCTFSADLPHGNAGPLNEALPALAADIDSVKQQTGATKVSLVGHSQGGILARAYVKSFAPDGVADVVAIGSPQRGIPLPAALLRTLLPECPGCPDFVLGSAFLRDLNKGDDTPGSAAYTNIETANEQFFPWTGAMLLGDNTANVLLQSACPVHFVMHVGLFADPLVRDWVVNALETPGPANTRRRVQCPKPYVGRVVEQVTFDLDYILGALSD